MSARQKQYEYESKWKQAQDELNQLKMHQTDIKPKQPSKRLENIDDSGIYSLDSPRRQSAIKKSLLSSSDSTTKPQPSSLIMTSNLSPRLPHNLSDNSNTSQKDIQNASGLENEDVSKMTKTDLRRMKYIQSTKKNKKQPAKLKNADNDSQPKQIEEESKADNSIPYNEAISWLTESSKRLILSQLLLQNDKNLMKLLYKGITNGPIREALAYSMLPLFIFQGKDYELLTQTIEYEIENSKNVNVLFRGEDLPSRLLSAYTRIIGKEYCEEILGELINEVNNNNYHYEIDPLRNDSNSMNIKQNYAKLENLAQRFLDKIISSYDKIPTKFIQLCNYICEHSETKYKDSGNAIIAGFIFLRFICPAITNPESFGLIKVENEGPRRTLVLVGKILQNLANGVEFKEEYLLDMNSFIQKNEKRLNGFFTKLRTYPPFLDPESNHIMDIARCIYTFKDKLVSLTSEYELEERLWSIPLTVNLFDRVTQLVNSICNAVKLEEDIPLLQSFANMLLDNDSIVSSIVIIGQKDKEMKAISENLVTIFCSSSEMPLLFRIVVENEIAESAYHYLHQSFTKYMFTYYSIKYCSEWLKNVLGDVIENIVNQNMIIDLSVNSSDSRKKLLKLIVFLIEQIITGLNNCPMPLWVLANALVTSTTQDVFQFFFINYFSLALESPDLYKLTPEKPKGECSNTLKIISDSMRNLANSSSILYEGMPMDHALKEKFSKNLNEWANNTPRFLDSSVQSDSLQSIVQSTLKLSLWIKENLAKFSCFLDSSHTTCSIQFTLKELLLSLEGSTIEVHQKVINEVEESKEGKKKNKKSKETKDKKKKLK